MLRITVIALVLLNLSLLVMQARNPAETGQPVTAAEMTDDAGIPTIHLIDELLQQQELLPGRRQCFSLGPFHTAEARDEVRALLRGVVTGVSERQTQAMVERGYWVFLPPYASLLEANRALFSLRALGLDDIAIIKEDDEWKNAISLGYFLRQANASRRAGQLQERGYDAQVRVSRRAEPRFWLDYEQEPGAPLLTLDMPERASDFQQRMLPCPELGFFSAAEIASQPEPAATPAEDDGETALPPDDGDR